MIHYSLKNDILNMMMQKIYDSPIRRQYISIESL